MDWDVIEVHPEPPLALKVRFSDGTQGKVRFEPSHLTGVFAPLKDPLMFSQVHIDHGALTWPGDVDLAPDAMYDAIKSHGEWVLR
uniref:DUF2442 domain-containing protein n=1 Tax=Thiobacillus sp. TaxID=924 RepID=UPI00159EDFC8|nr:DUF2442 domain-containing protein [Thiobacillus sp.]